MTVDTVHTRRPGPNWRAGFNQDEKTASERYWDILPKLLRNRLGTNPTTAQVRAELETLLFENELLDEAAHRWKSTFLRAALDSDTASSVPSYLAGLIAGPTLPVDMLGNVLHVGDEVAVARFDPREDVAEIDVQTIREISGKNVHLERNPREVGIDVERAETVVRILRPEGAGS